MAPASGRRPPGELATTVLGVLRAASEPLSVQAVLAGLDDDLGYTTVATVLDRLHAKGEVVRRRAGRGFVYEAVTDERSFVAGEVRNLLNRAGDRRSALQGLVAGLDRSDTAALEQLLAEANRRRGTRR